MMLQPKFFIAPATALLLGAWLGHTQKNPAPAAISTNSRIPLSSKQILETTPMNDSYAQMHQKWAQRAKTDPQQAWKELRELRDEDRIYCWRYFLTAWADLASEAVWKWALTATDAWASNGDRRSGIEFLLEYKMARDPEHFWDWYEQAGFPGLSFDSKAGQALLKNQSRAVESLLARNDVPPETRSRLADSLAAFKASVNAEAALIWAKSLPENLSKAAVLAVARTAAKCSPHFVLQGNFDLSRDEYILRNACESLLAQSPREGLESILNAHLNGAARVAKVVATSVEKGSLSMEEVIRADAACMAARGKAGDLQASQVLAELSPAALAKAREFYQNAPPEEREKWEKAGMNLERYLGVPTGPLADALPKVEQLSAESRAFLAKHLSPDDFTGKAFRDFKEHTWPQLSPAAQIDFISGMADTSHIQEPLAMWATIPRPPEDSAASSSYQRWAGAAENLMRRTLATKLPGRDLAEWAARTELPPVVTAAVRNWMLDDETAASAWAVELPKGKLRDAAAAAISNQSDDAEARLLWADSIQNADEKTQVMKPALEAFDKAIKSDTWEHRKLLEDLSPPAVRLLESLGRTLPGRAEPPPPGRSADLP